MALLFGRKPWCAILSIAIFTTSLGVFAPIHSVSAAPVLVENFNNNSFDSTIWHTFQLGNGSSLLVANQELQVALSPNSFDDPARGAFGAGLVSKCKLQGAFDMQVGFRLQVWPLFNGVRTGLGSIVDPNYATHYAVERVSFAGVHDNPLGEYYVTDLLDGVQGIAHANDSYGMLRITRSGGVATAYYFSSGSWILLHSGPMTTGDVLFAFGIWSHNYVFSHQAVKVAFDNFTLNNGQVLCPAITASPTNGPIGTRVTVHGSGFSTPQGFPIGIPSVVVKFDDMTLGSTTNNGGFFAFTLDVPEAQPGVHEIKAIDFATQTNATAFFVVTIAPAALSVSLSVGTVYFPGDTAITSVLVTSNGVPVGQFGLQLNITLTGPDNSKVTLNATSIGGGLFKVSYAISRTALIGTYSILAVARDRGTSNASAIGSFEVKLPWLSSQMTATVVGGAASIATIGIALVFWRKGYVRRSTKEPF